MGEEEEKKKPESLVSTFFHKKLKPKNHIFIDCSFLVLTMRCTAPWSYDTSLPTSNWHLPPTLKFVCICIMYVCIYLLHTHTHTHTHTSIINTSTNSLNTQTFRQYYSSISNWDKCRKVTCLHTHWYIDTFILLTEPADRNTKNWKKILCS